MEATSQYIILGRNITTMKQNYMATKISDSHNLDVILYNYQILDIVLLLIASRMGYSLHLFPPGKNTQ